MPPIKEWKQLKVSRIKAILLSHHVSISDCVEKVCGLSCRGINAGLFLNVHFFCACRPICTNDCAPCKRSSTLARSIGLGRPRLKRNCALRIKHAVRTAVPTQPTLRQTRNVRLVVTRDRTRQVHRKKQLESSEKNSQRCGATMTAMTLSISTVRTMQSHVECSRVWADYERLPAF